MNDAIEQRKLDRREFFRAVGRYSILGGLAALVGGLVRRGGAQPAGETCIRQGYCSRCPVLASCGLPRGLSAKQVLREGRP